MISSEMEVWSGDIATNEEAHRVRVRVLFFRLLFFLFLCLLLFCTGCTYARAYIHTYMYIFIYRYIVNNFCIVMCVYHLTISPLWSVEQRPRIESFLFELFPFLLPVKFYQNSLLQWSIDTGKKRNHSSEPKLYCLLLYVSIYARSFPVYKIFQFLVYLVFLLLSRNWFFPDWFYSYDFRFFRRMCSLPFRSFYFPVPFRLAVI